MEANSDLPQGFMRRLNVQFKQFVIMLRHTEDMCLDGFVEMYNNLDNHIRTSIQKCRGAKEREEITQIACLIQEMDRKLKRYDIRTEIGKAIWREMMDSEKS